MNIAAVKTKTPAVDFLATLEDLIGAGRYKDAAIAYKDFVKAHPTSDFLVIEALPYRVQNQMIKAVDSPTAFSIYSLRNPTWTTEIVSAFEDPEKFEAFMKKLEADVRALKK